ncbi:MAG: hypothetical protein Q9168_006422 [Polycauliona sp. 1 TL-2023]
MESGLEVDLAKQEVTAQQALESPLGQSLPNRQAGQTLNADLREQPRRSSKSGSATTNQPRLKPKAPSNRQNHTVLSSVHGDEAGSFELKSNDETQTIFRLQPVDEGFGAWSYVASAFAMYIVVWGFPQSFPIFQTYLSSRESAELPDSKILPLLAPGLQDIEEGLLFQFLPRSATYRPAIVTTGITIMVLAMVLASFASSAAYIVATQGVLYGLGGILLNFVHVSVFSEWFDRKRGQAMGLIWLGFRFGGLAFPLICQWLLDKHGYAKTLRVLIAPMLALLAPSIFLLRGRYPASHAQVKPVRPPTSKMEALRTPTLPFYLLVAVLFAAVINVPMMFITKFAADLGLNSTDKSLALSLVFLGSLLGPYFHGRLSDNTFHPSVLSASALLTSLMHTLFWGFVKTKSGLFGYAIVIGTISGGFRNSMFAFYTEISAGSNELFTAIHSIFSFFDGLAILSVGPVGTALLTINPEVRRDAYAIGKYQPLIIYAGGMTLASGLLAIAPVFFQYARSLWARR